LHAECYRGGVHARHTRADHDHFRGVHTRDATHQHSTPTVGAHQSVRADLRCESSGHLTHWRQQRKTPVGQFDRLVRDRGGAGAQYCVGAFARGRQMQVGEHHLAGADPVVLLGDGLLDLQHHLGVAPDIIGRVT